MYAWTLHFNWTHTMSKWEREKERLPMESNDQFKSQYPLHKQFGRPKHAWQQRRNTNSQPAKSWKAQGVRYLKNTNSLSWAIIRHWQCTIASGTAVQTKPSQAKPTVSVWRVPSVFITSTRFICSVNGRMQSGPACRISDWQLCRHCQPLGKWPPCSGSNEKLQSSIKFRHVVLIIVGNALRTRASHLCVTC